MAAKIMKVIYKLLISSLFSTTFDDPESPLKITQGQI